MFSHRVSAVLTSAIGAAAIGVTALATSASAVASTADDTFIAQMKAVGVTFDSPQAAVKTGHQVCKDLAAGQSGTEIAREILSQTDLTTKQAAAFVVNATNIYCPQYASQLA
jgi:hypothetical protein